MLSTILPRTALRTTTALARASLSTSAIRCNAGTANKKEASELVASHQAPGPAVVHESAREIAADVVSDAPAELRFRPVRIYKPTKTTMQSAKGKTKRWLIDWDTLQGAGRWENPLMGWASSADYMQGTQMAFPSKEEAVAFAERQGWEYQVETPHEPKIPPKNYANNYVHVPGKLRICHTK